MKIIKIAVIIVLVAGFASTAFCEEVKRTARIIEVNGDVDVRLGEENFIPAEVGMVLAEMDLIRTGSGSTAVLNLDGEAETAIVEMSEGSELLLAELLKDEAKKALNTYGEALNYELIKEQKYGNSIIRFVYIIKCRQAPLIWEFYFYKAVSDWELITVAANFKGQYDLLADK